MPATKTRKKRKSADSTSAAKQTNVSEEVRKILKKDKSAKPKQISSTLAKRGIVVKPTYVSIIKSKYLAGKGSSAGASRKSKPSAGKFDLGDLVEAKKFADQIGGLGRARAALDAIAKLS